MNVLSRPGGLPPIAYRVDGSGAALVLLHGVGGDASNWDDVVARLRRFRVIRLDLRGHGRSGPILGPVRAEDLARDVADVMDAAEAESACVAGFSLGGAVAMALALDAPQRVKKLALVSAVGGRTAEEQVRARERVEFLRKKGVAALADSNRERWFTDAFRAAHPDKVEARVRQVRESDEESYLRAFTVFATADYADRLHGIRVPALVITGEHDVAATPRMARLMHMSISGSRLEVVAGLRHSLLIEAPQTIATLLDGFF